MTDDVYVSKEQAVYTEKHCYCDEHLGQHDNVSIEEQPKTNTALRPEMYVIGDDEEDPNCTENDLVALYGCDWNCGEVLPPDTQHDSTATG